ncbi:MAG: NAD+ synthase [Candidatus Eisenbacteria bacterium]|nr:NAD+ synthase [Candidatus Eisenbacteria bacterium]
MKLRIGLAQINTTVGDLHGNAERMIERALVAEEAGADLVAFPELAVSGYPPEDLLFRGDFLEGCRDAVERIAASSGEAALVVGFPERDGEGVYNAAAILQRGRIRGVYRKNVLPNYGVFDENRYFRSGFRGMLLEMSGARIAIHVCEDSWRSGGAPVERVRAAGAGLLLNISASPYSMGKMEIRRRTLAEAVAVGGAPVAYVNLVGGQDELVFDGGSIIVGAGGAVLAEARRFEEDLLLYGLDFGGTAAAESRDDADGRAGTWDRVSLVPRSGGERPPLSAAPVERIGADEEVYRALLLGTRDYVRKNGFRRVVVGVSGGIDSALVAVIARDALGGENVIGVTMPSRFTSEGTRGDADALAERLGMEWIALPIEPVVRAYEELLAGPFAEREPDVTEENIQARVRGNLLMALSNKFGWLVLSTGNKSETAVGYCTLYGDMAGGLAVLKDVPKTLVYRLARWRNARPDGPVIPEGILERPPTAELRPDQKDSDSLPEYDRLDPIIEEYVERDADPRRIAERLADPETVRRVVRLVDGNEYKRRQAPPGIKITPKAFGKDRRMPITNRYGGGF